MNITKLPTHKDYESNNNWTVVLVKLIIEGGLEPKVKYLESAKQLRESGLFDHKAFTLNDYRRIAWDVKQIMEENGNDVTEILHPSQHLLVNVSFDIARKMQKELTKLGFEVAIFPTTCY